MNISKMSFISSWPTILKLTLGISAFFEKKRGSSDKGILEKQCFSSLTSKIGFIDYISLGYQRK